MIHSIVQQTTAFITGLPWMVLTLIAYGIALYMYRRSRGSAFFLPVFWGVLLVLGVLHLTGADFAAYAQGNKVLEWLIGPATVALAIPLYGQLHRLKRYVVPIAIALGVGSLTAVVSAVGIAWLFDASLQTRLSLAPKSATMPIAMDIAKLTGGIASLASIGVAITGIGGAMAGSFVLKWLPVKTPEAQGFALGLTAHAIGVARGLQINETAGAFAALGMGLNGIASAVIIPVFWGVFG